MKMRITLAVLALLMAGCAARAPAPVVDRAPPSVSTAQVAPTPAAPEAQPAPQSVPTYTVKKGDTLVSIALQFGLDYRELAAWNNISNPAKIAVGQVLVVAAPPGTVTPAPAVGATPLAGAPVATPLGSAGPPIEARPLANTRTVKVEPRGEKLPFSEKALAQLAAREPAIPDASAPPPVAAPTPDVTAGTTPVAPPAPPAATDAAKGAGTDKEDIDWMWPVKGGKVIAPFSEATKGMDIGARKGAPVVAAASGRVIYADQGLRGYGKLVIIRHNNTWLSAYAHNEKILVKEQDEVKKGQKIAEMGASDADRVKLHFEIRRQGKPVDPAKLLPPAR